MPLRTVSAVRYITPLREGGSMPALVEADDGRQYVVKLRGAGQGPLALVAELLVGELARELGLNVPKLVFVNLDPLFGKAERDTEIRDLLRASSGTNIGLEFLAGSTTFDPAAGDEPSAETASLVVWLDAFTLNVDRTSRNANLLLWGAPSATPGHAKALDIWLIDHGAALYFHHHWPGAEQKASAPFAQIAEHVLLRWATDIEKAGSFAYEKVTGDFLTSLVAQIPDDWLETKGAESSAGERRSQYLQFFRDRLKQARIFEKEAERARADGI